MVTGRLLQLPALSGEQRNALDAVLDLVDSGRTYATLGGLAGTGKTTLIRSLLPRLPNPVVAAYTGKAAEVLRRKTVRASTIHSLIYQPIGTTLQKDRREPRQVPRFRRHSLDALRHFSHIVIDEASMVPQRIHEDLLLFGKSIIYVGDHGQLPPVAGVGGSQFNLMSAPDVALETIHRNSGEIVKFAHFLRSGGRASAWGRHPDATGEGVEFVDRKWLKTADPNQGEQVITAFNRDRIDLNRRIRRTLGFDSTDGNRPEVGERLICLQNNQVFGVFNGMMGDVTAIDAETLTFRSAGVDFTVPYAAEQFGNAEKSEYCKDKCVFDFAYAITSQFRMLGE